MPPAGPARPSRPPRPTSSRRCASPRPRLRRASPGAPTAQAVVEALAQTELAVQTAVAVRDKVVEAYQEILRMPV
jgi:hypothetical protein